MKKRVIYSPPPSTTTTEDTPMKKLTALFIALALILGLCTCAQSATATWQEQYDLGIRYLSEGNYREAIIAFNAAIEIDPKQVDVYMNLADAYIALGDLDSALQTLRDGYAATGDVRLQARIDELTVPKPTPEPTPTPTHTPSTTVVASGDCGENVTWTLDSSGLLIISGAGPMGDYENGTSPWYEWYRDITKAIIDDGVTSIGDWTFAWCSRLTSVTIGNSVTSIGDWAFSGCGLTSVTIPNSVSSIGDLAFQICISLTSVTIPDSVTHIEDGAFSDCTRLASIEVTSGNPAYCSVDGILFSADQTLLHTYPAAKSGSTYNVPASVTSIGRSAFHDCKNLTSVTIPNSVTSIGYSAFYHCANLTNINVASGNSAYSSMDGVLFNADQTLLHTYPMAKSGSTYNIPASVTSIGRHAFASCSGLTSVTVPNSVTSIEHHAFLGCSGLTSVTIPESVITIGFQAFYGCSSQTDIYYSGSEAQWSQIAIDERNDPLYTATIHYNS